MKEELFLQILFETKVNAIRHHSKEEAFEAVQKIKTAIKQHRFEIVDRDKNLNFLHDERLSKETACQLIDMFIEPKNLIAILPNRNKEDGELYLFSIVVPVRDRKKYIYLKVEITSYGKVICISMHGQNEMMRVDYRQATDRTGTEARNFMRKMYQNWERAYNSFNDNKMIDAFPSSDEDITIVFKHSIDDTEEFRKNFCRTVSKDYGYKFKDIERNMSIEGDCVKVHLPFGHF